MIGRPRHLGDRPRRRVVDDSDRLGADDPVLPGAVQQAPAGADPLQDARDPAHTAQLEGELGVERGHQPAGQRHLGVLAPAAVGEVEIALGVVEGLCLLLEVVEDREQLLFPAHERPRMPRPSHRVGCCGETLATECKKSLTYANIRKRGDRHGSGDGDRVLPPLPAGAGAGHGRIGSPGGLAGARPARARYGGRSGALAGDPFDEVLVDVCEVALTGCIVWLWLATAVVASGAARGRTP